LSAPASTVLGTALCTLQRLICDLQALISTGAVADAIDLLNTLLAQLNVIPRVPACHVPSPRMNIDIPRNGSQLRQPFVVGGWALDATAPDDPGVDTVHVWAYPASGAAPRFLGASYGRSRPDVAAAFGSQFLLSGFSVHVTGLTPGAYRIVAFGRVTATNGFDVSRIADVTIRGGAFVAIDAPAQRATVDRPFLVGGWAADPGASSGTGVNAVHVWAYPVVPAGGGPVFLGSAAYGGHRPDVGAFLGSQFTPSGYNLIVSSLAPGTWDIAVFPLSTVSGAFESARVVRVTVR
jgi:hypothetical protein